MKESIMKCLLPAFLLVVLLIGPGCVNENKNSSAPSSPTLIAQYPTSTVTSTPITTSTLSQTSLTKSPNDIINPKDQVVSFEIAGTDSYLLKTNRTQISNGRICAYVDFTKIANYPPAEFQFTAYDKKMNKISYYTESLSLSTMVYGGDQAYYEKFNTTMSFACHSFDQSDISYYKVVVIPHRNS